MFIIDSSFILCEFAFSIKETMHVRDDHTFGLLVKSVDYGVGDLMHQRPECNYRRGRERDDGVISAVRHQLKKANYHNFDTLLQAFQHYDKVIRS